MHFLLYDEMMKSTQSLSPKTLLFQLGLTLLFVYLMTPLGATFNGLVDLNMHPMLFAVMGVLVVSWLWVRWRHGWEWHRTVFDGVFAVWGVAFAISILANPETARRSLIGLWYIGIYLGMWLVLHDVLANKAVTRLMLVDSFLFAGILLVLVGSLQWLNSGFSVSPVGTIGNTNAYGAILLMLAPLALMRAWMLRLAFSRWLVGLYAFVIMSLLILTRSRGAWLGLGASIVVMIVLVLKQRDLLSRSALRQFWSQQSSRTRLLLSIGTVGIVLVGSFGIVWILNSLSMPGRTLDLRIPLWSSALSQFAEQPLSGQGLFTFGRGYPLQMSIPPNNAHSHAHNLILNIMAEMGFLGLLAFVLSIFVTIRAIRHNWTKMTDTQRPILIGTSAVLVGVFIHHLVDLPSMMPIVALSAFFLMVMAVAPDESQAIESVPIKRGYSVGIIGLWLGLLISGWWSHGVYQQYIDVLKGVYLTSELGFSEGAIELEGVVEQDPMMPIYHQQQAYLWGLSASEDDEHALEQAIPTYEHFLKMEPNHAISWANLASLYWQAGEDEEAINSIERAIELAPLYAFFQRQREVYQGGALGNTDLPSYAFSQNYERFQFFREVIDTPFLPQVGWGSR